MGDQDKRHWWGHGQIIPPPSAHIHHTTRQTTYRRQEKNKTRTRALATSTGALCTFRAWKSSTVQWELRAQRMRSSGKRSVRRASLEQMEVSWISSEISFLWWLWVGLGLKSRRHIASCQQYARKSQKAHSRVLQREGLVALELHEERGHLVVPQHRLHLSVVVDRCWCW